MFVLEILASNYIKFIVWMIYLTLEPLEMEQANIAVYMRSSFRARHVYGHWVMGTWRFTIIQMFRVLTNISKLRTCGMDHSMAKINLNTEMVDEANVACDDSLADDLRRIVLGQVKYRTIEGFYQSYLMPHMFAVFAMDPQKYGTHFEKYKKKMWASLRAFLAMSAQTHEVIVNMCRNSFWRTGLGILCMNVMLYGGEEGFNALIEYLGLMFHGFGTAKPMEEANNWVKTRVMNARHSTVHKLSTLWSIAREMHLLASYGRKEVRMNSTLPVPRDPPAAMFQPTMQYINEEGGDTELDLESVTTIEPPTWCNLKSIDFIQVAAESHIMQTFHETQCLFPEKLWQVALLPEWEIVVKKQAPNKRLLVIAVVGRRAAITCELQEDIDGFLEFPTEVRDFHPHFLIVDNIYDYRVLPTRTISPFGMRVAAAKVQQTVDRMQAEEEMPMEVAAEGVPPLVGDEEEEATLVAGTGPLPLNKLGVKLMIDGDPRDVLDFQCDRGFLGCDSETLRDLAELLKVSGDIETAASLDAHSLEESRALMCLLQLKPQLQMLEALKALRKRRSSTRDYLDISAIKELLDSGAMLDLLSREDYGKVRDFVADAQKWNEQAEKARGKAQKHVESCYQRRLGKEDYKEALKVFRDGLKQRAWKATITVSDDYIAIRKKLLPDEDAQVAKNRQVGCFTATYKRKYVESFSWTMKRGPGEALSLAIRACWTEWTKANLGIPMPDRVNKQLEKLVDMEHV